MYEAQRSQGPLKKFCRSVEKGNVFDIKNYTKNSDKIGF